MSRIGRMPITVPAGVDVTVADGNVVTVKGPKGTLTQAMSTDMTIKCEGGVITVERHSEEKQYRALHGLTRSLIANMVEGVANGYKKELEVNGVGYRVAKEGKTLVLTIGYSHLVKIDEEPGITFECPDANHITISGADKQRVGEVAAIVRSKRPPEPYHGKGIKYVEEHIRRKSGKAGK